MMRHAFALLVILMSALAAGQTYDSVQDAVESLPQLSLLAANTRSMALANTLRDPAFLGTLFAPTDQVLATLQETAGTDDLTSLITDVDQLNEVFSTSVVPGKALMLADLSDGMKLTTLNGKEVMVSIVSVPGGKAYYINKARIAVADIKAGKSVMHLMAGIVAPSDLQDVLDSFIPPEDSGGASPTLLWSDVTAKVGTSSPAPSSPSPSPTPDGGGGGTSTPSSGTSDAEDAALRERILAANNAAAAAPTSSAAGLAASALVCALPFLAAALL